MHIPQHLISYLNVQFLHFYKLLKYIRYNIFMTKNLKKKHLKIQYRYILENTTMKLYT